MRVCQVEGLERVGRGRRGAKSDLKAGLDQEEELVPGYGAGEPVEGERALHEGCLLD